MGKSTKFAKQARPVSDEQEPAAVSDAQLASETETKPVASTSKTNNAALTASLDFDAPPKDETRGQMLQRHKKEAKLLKELAKKLGKKKKEEADKLSNEMEARHEVELAGLREEEPESESKAPVTVVAPTDGLYSLSLGAETGVKKPTKAQKRREKAEAAEAEREARIADANAALGDSDRVQEERSLAEVLRPLGMGMRDIPPDGHCMYRAVEDQLHLHGCEPTPDYQHLRDQTAAYMRSHPSDFLPFLAQEAHESHDSGANPEEHYETYCKDIKNTAAWGGQLELGALSNALQRHITVFAVGQPNVEMGSEYKGKSPSLHLCYLRHAYGLGEHYNSLAPIDHGQAGPDVELRNPTPDDMVQ